MKFLEWNWSRLEAKISMERLSNARRYRWRTCPSLQRFWKSIERRQRVRLRLHIRQRSRKSALIIPNLFVEWSKNQYFNSNLYQFCSYLQKGESTKISCEFDGFPKPSPRLAVDGHEVKSNELWVMSRKFGEITTNRHVYDHINIFYDFSAGSMSILRSISWNFLPWFLYSAKSRTMHQSPVRREILLILLMLTFIISKRTR